jgi:hypothetical protein
MVSQDRRDRVVRRVAKVIPDHWESAAEKVIEAIKATKGYQV